MVYVPSSSVYVHFPYCLTKCPYCDFVSYKATPQSIDHAGYADAILHELDQRLSALRELDHPWEGRHLDSIFFGGGTPSLWDPAALGRVIRRLVELFPSASTAEISVECNPTSLDEDRARALADVGVNRLSIGVQSLRADQLRFLGRLHNPDQAQQAVVGAQKASVRVSADLIFGLPEQSPEDARDQAMALRSWGLDHLSCYQLTIEPGTQFGELAKRGRLPLADDGRVAESFGAIDEALTNSGLRHYEISNYATPGNEARHNLGYWQGGEYLGLGCGAYGFVATGADARSGTARGIRYRNAIDPVGYLSASQSVSGADIGTGDGLSISSEALDGETLLKERIMLGLRLAGGFPIEQAADVLGVEPWPSERARAMRKLVERGRLQWNDPWLRIPPDAWLWADDTAARLF